MRLSLVSLNDAPLVQFSTFSVSDDQCPRTFIELDAPAFLPDPHWGRL